MLEGTRGMCKTYSRLLRRKIKCKKREEKMEKRDNYIGQSHANKL